MTSTPTAPASRPSTAPAASTGRRFRPEVQGLRALAVMMVVCYHIWLGRVSGGVDVFLMLSAFLLTGSFVRKVERDRPLALVAYWVHLFKRLLPAAVTVILLVVGVTALLLPPSTWRPVVEQAWASLAYVQNWLLASQSVDYYAAHDAASPLQHFWSLSIQGQVFILWPLLFLAGRAVTGLLRRRVPWVTYRTMMAGIFAAVFVASLIFSVVETSTNQAFAYFDTRARLYEFAAGSLLALIIDRVAPPRRLRVVLGWAGVVAMLGCGFILTVDRAFPGIVALWPVLAASAIVVAGQTGSPAGVDRILSSRPLVKLGDVSYALYLVHWPALIIYTILAGRDPGPRSGLALVAGAIVLAWLITRFVERPIRSNARIEAHRTWAAAVIVVCVALVATPLTVWQHQLDADRATVTKAGDTDHPGARVLADPALTARAGIDPIPATSVLDDEFATLPEKCGEDVAAADVIGACDQTAVPDGGAAKTLYVVGDSHAEQWLPPVQAVAERNRWHVVSMIKGGCAWTAGDGTDECSAHNRRVLDTLTRVKPDAVVVVSTAASVDAAQDTVRPGFGDAVTTLTDHGIEVVGLRDNPRYDLNRTTCTERYGIDAPECNPDRATKLTDTNPADALADRIQGFHSLDLTDLVCNPRTCAPVEGNVRVYLDDNHLTETYTSTMADAFAERLFAATTWKGA